MFPGRLSAMHIKDLITKKRCGEELTAGQIRFLVEEYSEGIIPDYQVSALLMAVCFQGMSDKEVINLTVAMAESGEMFDLQEVPGKTVDKHSTGGVGDKTTLVLAPLVAAAGIPVAKMSGRGLGHTGGTIDKLESIPGLSAAMSRDRFVKSVAKINIAVAEQTDGLVPADKKLYALRDATSTADSVPLIASSIMSKKLAGGADGVVLDVKVGDGALVNNEERARELANLMVSIGAGAGIETTALITDMNQPLGEAVGNSLEVTEAIAALKGEGPSDLHNLVLKLGSHMLVMADRVSDPGDAVVLLERLISEGKALQKFAEFVENQGGDPAIVDDVSLLPQADVKLIVKAQHEGFLQQMHTRKIGLQSARLGAGRMDKDSRIDPAVGIVFKKKVGDWISKGDHLAALHLNSFNCGEVQDIKERLREALVIKDRKPVSCSLIREIIFNEDLV